MLVLVSTSTSARQPHILISHEICAQRRAHGRAAAQVMPACDERSHFYRKLKKKKKMIALLNLGSCPDTAVLEYLSTRVAGSRVLNLVPRSFESSRDRCTVSIVRKCAPYSVGMPMHVLKCAAGAPSRDIGNIDYASSTCC